jgi:HAD superfamily hydrolase (TIGR01490 family)
MKPTIAAFDFDGTITTRDTLWEFIKKTHNPLKIAGNLILALPLLLLYKTGFVNNGKAKQTLFSRFYKNWSVEKFNDSGRAFKPVIDACLRPEVYRKLKEHLANGHKVIIVSASIENWILPWAEKEGIEAVIATQIEVSPLGKLTGRFMSPNCYGEEKVRRMLALFPERSRYTLIVYGDSKGDTAMLRLADKNYYLKNKKTNLSTKKQN